MSTAAFDRPNLPVAALNLAPRERRRGVSAFRKLAAVVGDGLMLVGIILFLPIAVLLVGIPVALVIRLVLWIIRLM